MYSEFISRWNNPFTYKAFLDFWDIRGTPSGCQVSWLWRKHLYIDVSGFWHDFFFCGSPGLTSTLAFEKKATQYKKTMFHPKKYPNQQSNPWVVKLLPNPWGLNCRFHCWAEKNTHEKIPWKKTKTSHYFEDETPPHQNLKFFCHFSIFFQFFFPFPKAHIFRARKKCF